MKKNIAKNYFSKIVAAMFGLAMLVYGQCGYAIKLTHYKDVGDGKNYYKVAVEEEVTTLTPNIIYAIEKILKEQERSPIPVGTIDLGGLSFMPGSFSMLMRILQNTSLTVLELDGCGLGSEDSILIAELIRRDNIDILNISNNRFSIHDLQYILEALTANTRLNCINLSGYKLDHESIVRLVNVIKRNSVLSRIILNNTDIRDERLITLAEYLRTNQTVNRLVIGHNGIGNHGAVIIGEVLLANTALRSLQIVGNNIGDEGVIAIANALRFNRTLVQINLLQNPISAMGAWLFLRAIAENITLQRIQGDWTQVHEDTIGLIMKRNAIINQLSVKVNQLRHDTRLAVLLGTHLRIGQESPLKILDGYILRNIFTYTNENELSVILTLTEAQLLQFTAMERRQIEQIKELHVQILERIRVATEVDIHTHAEPAPEIHYDTGAISNQDIRNWPQVYAPVIPSRECGVFSSM